MPERIPFAIVEIEVVKLYERGYALTDVSAIEKHFEFIMEFLGACGWTPEAYTEELMQWNLQEKQN